jgi:hypothetical protein
MPRIPSIAASALVMLSLPALANAPVKVKVEGHSAYAEFQRTLSTCEEGAEATYAFAAFQESQSLDPTRTFRFVGVNFEWFNPCNPDSPYIYGHGASDIPDPTFYLVKETSAIDKHLREGSIQAILPVQIEGVGLCTATIDLDVSETRDKAVRTAGVTHTWRYGFKYVNKGVSQPAVAAGRISIGPLLLADGSSQPCLLPEGVPTEYAIGDSAPNFEIPTTFLSKTKATDFYRQMK